MNNNTQQQAREDLSCKNAACTNPDVGPGYKCPNCGSALKRQCKVCLRYISASNFSKHAKIHPQPPAPVPATPATQAATNFANWFVYPMTPMWTFIDHSVHNIICLLQHARFLFCMLSIRTKNHSSNMSTKPKNKPFILFALCVGSCVLFAIWLVQNFFVSTKKHQHQTKNEQHWREWWNWIFIH